MDINTNNNQGQMNNSNLTPQFKTSKKSMTSMVVLLVVVLVIVIAVIYFLGAKFSKNNVDQVNPAPVVTQVDNSLSASATKADDVNTLNADLDSQLKDIDYSF